LIFLNDASEPKARKDTLSQSAYQNYSPFSIGDDRLMSGLSRLFTVREFRRSGRVGQKTKGGKGIA
jgi:hypothetical protein